MLDSAMRPAGPSRAPSHWVPTGTRWRRGSHACNFRYCQVSWTHRGRGGVPDTPPGSDSQNRAKTTHGVLWRVASHPMNDTGPCLTNFR